MTVVSIEPHCFELWQYILDALYGKSRHRPSLPSLQGGKRGIFQPSPATAPRACTMAGGQ
jgi:hypothetical protein